MPIYAYKCESCGHRQDVLQKMSDPVLSQCPSCGEPRFVKQLTAAGFQLKGSGWYATDFRGGATPAAAETEAAKPADASGPAITPAPAAPSATPAASAPAQGADKARPPKSEAA
jgi:putative FmdB family regulatory protein